MSRIVIVPLQEMGHVLPTLQMAKALRRRGHEVVYLGLEDLRVVSESEGFDHVSICVEELPAGSLAEQTRRARRTRFHALASARAHEWRATTGQALCSGSLDATIVSLKADLFLIDCDWEDMLLTVASLGARIQAYAPNFGAAPSLRIRLPTEPEIPPMSSMSSRDKGAFAAFHRRVSWSLFHTNLVFDAAVFAANFRFSAKNKDMADAFSWKRATIHRAIEATKEAVKAFSSAVDGRVRSFRRRRELEDRFVAEPTRPRTLILCPGDLDFPSRRATHIEYCGPSIDLERRESDIELPPEDGRPLVFCTVGSQSHRAVHQGAFFRKVIEAQKRTRSYRLIIAAGDALDQCPTNVPDDIRLVKRAPQLKVLKRASAAIVHGGLGTIKECIWFGVPMLVLPGAHDQPGNAARIEYHDLGFARVRARIGVAEMSSLVTRLIVEPERRQRLADWSRRFQTAEREERHVKRIEARIIVHVPDDVHVGGMAVS